MPIVRSIAGSVVRPLPAAITGGDGPPQAPIISSVTISGDTRVGDVLSSSISYTQAPRPGGTPSYQWQRNAVNISGATGSSYTLVAADAGAAITLVFSITNSEGSDGPVTSNTINADALSAPVITGVPTVSGTPQEGQTLTATEASTAGNPPPATTWQWERDNVAISGATNSTYTLVSADENTDVTVVQTETNSQGSDTAESAGTAIQAPPVISTAPTISGSANVGSTLTATAGSVTGTPTPTRSWQWQTSANGTSGWSNISGATVSTYLVDALDENQYLRVVQTETNALGSDTSNSAATAQVGALSAYAANGFDPDFVADESLATPYYRVAGATSDYDTVYTSDTGAGGLVTQTDSSGNLVWGPHNLLTYSDDITNWSGIATRVTLAAGEITEDSSTGAHRMYHQPATTVAAQYTMMAKVKRGTGSRHVQIRPSGQGSGVAWATFNLDTVAVGASGGTGLVSATISAADADGYYACRVAMDFAAGSAEGIDVNIADSPTATELPSYTGDGSSSLLVKNVSLYRSDLGGMADVPADVRAANGASDFVPTTTAAKYLLRRGHYRYNGTAWVPTLLHEPVGATNLALYSNDITETTTGWTAGSTGTAAGVTGIDGVSASAVKLVAGSGGSTQLRTNQANVANVTDYVFWAILKDAGDGVFAGLAGAGIGAASEVPVFDLVNGTVDVAGTATVVKEAGIEPYNGDGFYLCWARITSGGIAGMALAVCQNSTDNTNSNYTWTGDDTSGYYVAHAQVEQTSDFYSSPIPTTGTTVTRAADTRKYNAAALSASTTAMSFAAKGRFDVPSGGAVRLFTWYQGGVNRLWLGMNISRALSGAVVGAGVQATANVGTVAAGVRTAVAGALRAVSTTAVQTALDGVAGTADTTGVPTIPDLSAEDLDLQASGTGTALLNGETDLFLQWDEDIAEAGIEEATA